MDFSPSPKIEDLQKRLTAFMDEHVYPAEKLAAEQVHASGHEHSEPPIVTALKQRARAQGLIAESRMEIDAARFMVLHAAWKDGHGGQEGGAPVQRQRMQPRKALTQDSALRTQD